ncbi:MAG: ATP-dependent DNA helicase RecG [Candidatus Magasanikbacteria bacterium]|nr:ATP-dependent DNA helicase RecG [Candidatus Magasanikbacteria bacterium]
MSDTSILLTQPVMTIPGCGEKIAKYLEKLDVKTVQDLFLHLPFRYEDHRAITPVAELVAGDSATVRVRVRQLRSRRAGRRVGMTIIEGLVGDDSGTVRVVWFQQSYLVKTLAIGEEIFLTGEVKQDRFGLQMVSPQYEKTNKPEALHSARIVPLYSLTEGLSHKQLRTLVAAAFEKYGSAISEWLPEELVKIAGAAPYATAMKAAHFPKDFDDLAAALQRFQFERALLQELQAGLIADFHAASLSRAFTFSVDELKSAVAALPFVLTDDQKKSVWAIIQDVGTERPMNRLLQGDVGSGKTVVAAIAAHPILTAGAKVLCMAPTQLLAEQHAKTFEKLFAGLGWPIVLMVGSGKRVAPPAGAAIIIGTHALIQDSVKFDEVGLVVVDEQHRFGVGQRKKIKEKNGAGYTPHFLSMTATPIPRSLALLASGTLSVSSIKQMPPGRKPVITRVVGPGARSKAEQFLRQHITAGEQVFVVTPLIDPSDSLGVVSATEVFEKISKETFPTARVGLVHGRLKPKDRAAVMDAFRAGELDILVATAVIEVGVDIPGATIMWIEGAERFGLAQLHQFRGRVGRSDKQSYAFLLSRKPISKNIDDLSTAEKRMKLMEEISDGFDLAEKDLEMRGSGDVWGTLQSGFFEYEELLAVPVEVWERAKRCAQKVFDEPEVLAHSPELRARLVRFEEILHQE